MSAILVDSSFWIGEARQRRDPVVRLGALAYESDLAICGVVRCEVARGVRDSQVLERLRRFWDVMIYLPTDAALWRSVEDLLWKLDRTGRQIPLPDAVIACCALRMGAAVLTYDSDFRAVPGLQVFTAPAVV